MNSWNIQEMLAAEKNEVLLEAMQDRLDIITHKIKFMEKVETFIADESFQIASPFLNILAAAGGKNQSHVFVAQKIMVLSPLSFLEDLNPIASNVNIEWLAAQNNQIYLLDMAKYALNQSTDFLTLIEDMAEILYPKQFIFGGASARWIQLETIKN